MKNRPIDTLYQVASLYYEQHMSQKDIAAGLFISVSNVSRILKECRENGIVTFDPENPHVVRVHHIGIKNPKLKNMGKIGFIIYIKNGDLLLREPLYVLMLNNFTDRVTELGYSFEIESIVDGTMIREQIKMLSERGYMGIVIFATEMQKEDFLLMKEVPIPCIYLDNNCFGLPLDNVMLATDKITMQIVEYLYQRGHCRIGYLRQNNAVSQRIEKEQYFKEAMASFGLSLDPRFIFSSDFTLESSYQQLQQQIHRVPDMPTAFFSDTDTIAFSGIKVFQQLGYDVPGDISVIGMDDRPVCQQIVPQITTAAIDMKAYSDYAIDLLMLRIREYKSSSPYRYPPTTIRLMTRIVERGSVGDVKPD